MLGGKPIIRAQDTRRRDARDAPEEVAVVVRRAHHVTAAMQIENAAALARLQRRYRQRFHPAGIDVDGLRTSRWRRHEGEDSIHARAKRIDPRLRAQPALDEIAQSQTQDMRGNTHPGASLTGALYFGYRIAQYPTC